MATNVCAFCKTEFQAANPAKKYCTDLCRNRAYSQRHPNKAKEYAAANKDKLREYRRKYRAENREHIIASKKKYREENRDRLNAESNKRYAENKEYHKEYNAARYAEHREARIEYVRQWRLDNPEKAAVNDARNYLKRRHKIAQPPEELAKTLAALRAVRRQIAEINEGL